ncbi:MAG: hypothetical protein O7I93_05520 [Gemmatimonadetes bacterium]|nr:hypothetical protein [Gemmatimonadota bacterium]
MPDEVLALSIISILSLTALGFGLLRTVSRHLERKWRRKDGGGSDQVLTELEELRSRLEGSEDIPDRVAELEDRVDFAERLLAEGKRPDQLRAEP